MSHQKKEIGFPPSSEKENQSCPRLYSATLFTHNREVIIEHAGEEYRLRLTSKGKLILTK
jgi:hemin uptake protein HemP